MAYLFLRKWSFINEAVLTVTSFGAFLKVKVSMSNSKAELVEAAKALGLSTSGKNKAQLLEAINGATEG